MRISRMPWETAGFQFPSSASVAAPLMLVLCMILNNAISCTHGELTAHPSNCGKYVQCDHDRRLIRSCPDGLYFSPASKTCDWPGNVECNMTSSTSTTTSTGRPEVTTSISTTTTTGRPLVVTSTTTASTTRPARATSAPSSSPASTVAVVPTPTPRNGGKKMVCYVGTWAVYRPGDGHFEMEDIDPHLCTHLVYGFTKLENNEIAVFDPWGDLVDQWGGGKGMYKRFTDLKKINPQLKTLIAIGGWNEGSTKYSSMARDPSSRAKFVKSIVPFLERHNFDGLDLDWEYPSTRGGIPEDKPAFSDLVRELRQELDSHGRGFLLTAAVSPNTKTVSSAYEVPVISQLLDFINVMCYDYHGFWPGHNFTGHNTPLYRHPLDIQFEPLFNVNDTVTFWLEQGLPKSKLILGMALYGRGFTLAKEGDHGLYAPITGGIPQGPYTRQDGTWGYNEICEKYMTQMDQWRIAIDPHVKAPYAFNGRNWISYEDKESLYYKAEYARNLGLGGAMVWSLETDDFRGKCHGGEKYPLLRTIVNTINGGGKPTIPQRPQIIPPDPDTSNEVEPSSSSSTTASPH